MKIHQTLLATFLILLGLQTTTALRNHCHNPPTDYIYHQTQSQNFGTKTVQGYMTDDAYEFDGKGAYRDFGTTKIPQEFTISFWARWDQFGSWSRIFDFGNGPAKDNLLFANNGGSRNALFGIFKKGRMDYAQKVNFIKQQAWNHYSVQSFKNGKAALYINGVKTGVYAGPFNKPAADVERIYSFLGRSNWGHDKYFKGIIDDFQIYGSAIAPEQIKCLADVCDKSCWASCNGASNKCDKKEEKDGVQFPNDEILSGDKSENKGSKEGGKGPATNNAFEFDGKGGYRDFGETIIGGKQTVTFWARFDSNNSWQRIMDFGNGPAKDNILFAEEGVSNNVTFYQFFYNKADIIKLSNGLDIGVWHHYALLSDRRGYQFIYRDGKKFGVQNPRSHGKGIPIMSRFQSYLGKSNWKNDKPFHGAIDDFKVFPRLLHDEEIALMGAVCPDKCSNEASQCALNSEFCQLKRCVTIYSECGFRGDKQEICEDVPKLNPQEVKSIEVPKGIKFSLYNGHGYKGQVAQFSGNVECIDDIDFQDKAQLKEKDIKLFQQSEKKHLKGNSLHHHKL